MSQYIETRKTWIKAIHKCIMEKWNPICMGCAGYDEPDCELCETGSCYECPLSLSGQRCNGPDGDPYSRTSLLTSKTHYPDGDEAMLEALVMLLPPEERKRYGG